VDERVREFIKEEVLVKRALWLDALRQLNPSYEMASTIEDLGNEKKLHPLCAEIFRADGGEPIRLRGNQNFFKKKFLRIYAKSVVSQRWRS